jgi:hypothetical protein
MTSEEIQIHYRYDEDDVDLGIYMLFIGYSTVHQEHPAFFRFWGHSKGIRDRLRQRETSVRY